ncbi:hypothetical protein BDZ89DRAFT_1124392 [Hymenopellis radicata]|nr:hypothetical protein BDZ89DRAFT_1124392 [Hymenopellis radicata]
MSPSWEDYGLTVADVQSMMSTVLHPIILLAFCHGIHTSIFFLALYYIIESTQPTRKRMTLAGIITFLWFANTVILALDWKVVDQLFIAHGTSLEMEFTFEFGTDDIAMSIAETILRILSVFVADLILVWRCWVLYGGNLKVIAIPGLCVITETVSACIVIVSSVEDANFVGATQINWSLVYYSMTVATNSLCTILILFRIVRVSGLGASLKTYRGIIEILVESAAMYAIIYIAVVIAYAYQFYTGATVATAYPYPEMISISITGIAPTLIIARVMAGQSRPNDSWTRPSLPHMRSDVLSSTESLQFASGPNHSTQTTSASTGDATADIDLEAQAQEIVEEPREQDGDEGRAEAGALASGHTLSAGKSTGYATADIDLEAQAQEIVEEPREQDGDEGRAEAGALASGHKLSAGKHVAILLGQYALPPPAELRGFIRRLLKHPIRTPHNNMARTRAIRLTTHIITQPHQISTVALLNATIPVVSDSLYSPSNSVEGPSCSCLRGVYTASPQTSPGQGGGADSAVPP